MQMGPAAEGGMFHVGGYPPAEADFPASDQRLNSQRGPEFRGTSSLAGLVGALKGNMYPLPEIGYSSAVNLKLTDREILSVCRELVARDPDTSGRAVRAELKRRHGSAGNTDRVFAMWRSIRAEAGEGAAVGSESLEKLRRQVVALQARLAEEGLAREAAEQRAFLSESRELTHQTRWAREVDALRSEVRELTAAAAHRGSLEDRVLALSREVAQLRAKLAPPVGG